MAHYIFYYSTQGKDMKKSSSSQAAVKKLASKIKQVNSQLDEICSLLERLEAEKKAVKKIIKKAQKKPAAKKSAKRRTRKTKKS